MSSSNFQDVEKTPLIASTPPEYFDEHDFLVLCKKQKRRRRLRIFSRILLLFVSSLLLWNYFSNEETFGCNSVASSTNRSDFKSFTLSPEKSKLFLKVEDRLSSPIEHLVDPSSDLKEVTVEISGYQSFRNVKVEKVVKDDEEGIVVENTNHWRMSNYWNGDKKNYGIRVIFPKDVKIKSFETFTDGNQVSADDLTGLQLDEWKVKSRDGSVRLGSIETKSLIEIESHFGSIQSSGLLKSNSIKLDSQNGAISLSQVKASKELRLHSSFASISGEFSSPILDFEGHSGSIRGTFNVSKELKLDSNMGSINGKINLVQDDDSNGEISITSSSEQGSNVLTFLNEVEDLKLNLNATSSMGKVDVTFVEDGFQGDFKIDSGLGSVHVEGPQDEKYDWEIVKENHGPVKSEVEGWVAKKGNGGKKGWGKLDLKTHLGSAHLKL